MADDMEKTEEPTSKKIEDAKKEGNVPKSQDIASFVTILVAIGAFVALFALMSQRVVKLYLYYMNLIGIELTKTVIVDIGIVSLRELVFIVIPLALMVAISGVIASVMQFGFIFTTKPLEPNFSKIDPIKGFGKLFGLKKMLDGVKITAKVAIVFFVAFYFLIKFTHELQSVILYDLNSQLIWIIKKAMILIAIMLILFAVFALIDLLIVRFQYFNDLKMSKQEIKDEYKQMEGDPQVKSRIKKLQMEMAQKRMMSDIPSADVVITNPTHYAVALRYDRDKENAPRIVGKGMNNLALKIKEIARENLIQVVENPPLARELYKSCEVDSTIPDALFKAVAEVLAFVYKARGEKFNR